MKTALSKKQNRFYCFDLLKMARQQEADKKIKDVLIVSDLLANFQRLIEEKCIPPALNAPKK
ncbi:MULTISPECIES: hypothetical protein [Emticicia]|uniref:hypothetical protein n=1 Tax=Emticicia TaxID=312278 RepID=UPI0020A21D81|nr:MULTISPECIES: hypothetical protein [Emticicia]UTA67357.1 hypothetical protein MB380_17405 [Emticicia sp. 21SJ11W-3]